MSAPVAAAASLDHVGLTLADLAVGRDFYGRAFAFAEELAFDLPGGVRGVMLLHPSGARLELFEAPDPEPGIGGRPPLEALRRLGHGHLALSTPELEALYAHALAEGATSVREPGDSPEPGVRFAWVADPEGNLVELIGR